MQHVDLDKNSWSKQSLVCQMANIGSEVFRALKWRSKHNDVYANAANFRALELFDLSLAGRTKLSELKEIARARELWLDFFIGDNQYHQTEAQWKGYFFSFNCAAQLGK